MAEEDDAAKIVLCVLGERKRTLRFSTPQGETDYECVLKAVRNDLYSDLIGTSKAFLQVKDEDWSDFTDLCEKDPIPNRSVLRVVVEEVQVNVLIMACGFKNYYFF